MPASVDVGTHDAAMLLQFHPGGRDFPLTEGNTLANLPRSGMPPRAFGHDRDRTPLHAVAGVWLPSLARSDMLGVRDPKQRLGPDPSSLGQPGRRQDRKATIPAYLLTSSRSSRARRALERWLIHA